MAVPDFTAAAPKHLIRLGVPGDRVMQSFQPVGDQWFVSKVGSGNNGDDTRIYRLDATGELLDWCTLAGGGHGSTMGYTTDGTDVWLWFWWRTDTTGGTYTNRCVRWKYRGSAEGVTVTRDDADVVELSDLWGDQYVTYSIDQANDLVAVDIRDSATATRTTELRKLSEYEAGTGNALHTVGPINVDYDAAYQGHTFDSDRLYIARGNVALGRPLTLHSYDWTSGAEQILTVTSDVYTTGDWLEIEGVAMHPTDGLLFGIATGPLGGRIADVYQVVQSEQNVTPPSTVHTFSTDTDPSLFLEQDVDGAPVRLSKDSAVLVRSATDGTPLPATKVTNDLGYLSFTTDGIPGVQVSGDDGQTWKGPFWSAESRASTITGDLSGSRLLDENTGQLRAPLVPPSVMPSDSTVAPIVSNTTTSTYAAVQTAAHAALDSTIATKVDKGEIVVNVMDHGAVGDGSTDDTAAFTSALAAGDRIMLTGARTYVVSQVAFRTSSQAIEIQDGCELRRLSTSSETGPMVLVNRNKARVFGGGSIRCDNACPDGIVRFFRDGGAAEWGRLTDIQVRGPGSTVTGSRGVVFSGPGATYQNVASGVVVSDVDQGMVFEDVANMNTAINCTLYNIGSTGFLFDDGNENAVVGGSISSSHGVTVLHFTNGARINHVIGLVAEPGTPATFRVIESGCDRNQIISCSDNTSARGTDNGAQTVEIVNNAVKVGVENIGFFGVEPTARPTVPTAGTVTADDLRAALVSLGLVQ